VQLFLRNILKKLDLIKVTLSKHTRSEFLHLCLKEHLKKLSSLLQSQVLNSTSLSQCSEILNLVVPLTSSSSHIFGIVANGYYTLLAHRLPFYLRIVSNLISAFLLLLYYQSLVDLRCFLLYSVSQSYSYNRLIEIQYVHCLSFLFVFSS
jgi:hypothetical protein